MIASNPQIIVSKNAIPARDLKELVAWVKANQDKVSFGTGGAGTPAHVSAAYFQQVTGTKGQIIHYRGAAPAMQDLLSGQIDISFDQAANSLPLDEAGLPGFYMSVWHGIWTTRGTPKPVVGKLNAAIMETLLDSTVRHRLVDLGQEIPSREQQSPAALGAHHKAEIDKRWPLIKSAGIKAE